MFRKASKEVVIKLFLLFPVLFLVLPLFILVVGSVMGDLQLKEYLSPVFEGGNDFVKWSIMPDYPTFSHYKELLLETPQFFILFWNSIKLVGVILLGQLFVGVPAAWAFAVYEIRGKKFLFSTYIALMLLPFQVTMLSSYIILNKLQLLNSHAAIILPAVFNTLPIFIIYGSFKGIPIALLEAARIDGASEITIFKLIGIPLCKTGVLSAMVLGFLEYWNMMEQPMAFLQDKSLWPLSLYLPEISWVKAGTAFCASLIFLILPTFVFLFGQDYLEQGIIYSGMKE